MHFLDFGQKCGRNPNRKEQNSNDHNQFLFDSTKTVSFAVWCLLLINVRISIYQNISLCRSILFHCAFFCCCFFFLSFFFIQFTKIPSKTNQNSVSAVSHPTYPNIVHIYIAYHHVPNALVISVFWKILWHRSSTPRQIKGGRKNSH